MPSYFAQLGTRGEVRASEVTGPVIVLRLPAEFMPIGQAQCLASDAQGFALWTLMIQGEMLTGLWRLNGGEFKRATKGKRRWNAQGPDRQSLFLEPG